MSNLEAKVENIMQTVSSDAQGYSVKAAALTGVCLLDLATGEAAEVLGELNKHKELYRHKVKHLANGLQKESSLASSWILQSAKRAKDGTAAVLTVLDRSDEEMARLRDVMLYTTKQFFDDKHAACSLLFARLTTCSVFLRCALIAFKTVQEGLERKLGRSLNITAYNVKTFRGALTQLMLAVAKELRVDTGDEISPEMEQAAKNIIDKIQTAEWLRKLTDKL
jgi:hypothetical protein